MLFIVDESIPSANRNSSLGEESLPVGHWYEPEDCLISPARLTARSRVSAV